MKKYFSFERIMLVLILIVLFFIPRSIAERQTSSYFYYVFDTRYKLVGEFNSSTPIQKGHLIFLGDDMYEVEYIICSLKKDKDKDILYSEDTHALYVKFIGKSREQKK
jgi:hypothetical protein